MLARRIQPEHEYYLAILNDRSLNGPALVASARGGMNIEDVARDEPEAIITHPINFENGLSESEWVICLNKHYCTLADLCSSPTTITNTEPRKSLSS